MGQKTEIAWTDHTMNPWWGCFKISPGCDNCYAATFDKRVHGIGKGHWGPQSSHRRSGDKHWNEPRKWNADALKAGVRRRVFCASMADVFEGRGEDNEDRARLFDLIAETPWLDWQLLTKRPENMVHLAPVSWANGWPANVWAGCTVEDQQRADERIPHLLRVPARVRFLSVEPMLSPIIFRGRHWFDANRDPMTGGIHWVIVGGESGGGARPFDLRWAVSIIDQCRAAGVACFFKQTGVLVVGLDGSGPCRQTGKGDDPTEWRKDLQVREFPAVSP